MKTVADVIGVSRSNLIERLKERPRQKRIGRLPDGEFLAGIKAVIAEMPTYGYRRIHAVLKRQALAAGNLVLIGVIREALMRRPSCALRHA
jgi:putative transposase